MNQTWGNIWNRNVVAAKPFNQIEANYQNTNMQYQPIYNQVPVNQSGPSIIMRSVQNISIPIELQNNVKNPQQIDMPTMVPQNIQVFFLV